MVLETWIWWVMFPDCFLPVGLSDAPFFLSFTLTGAGVGLAVWIAVRFGFVLLYRYWKGHWLIVVPSAVAVNRRM